MGDVHYLFPSRTSGPATLPAPGHARPARTNVTVSVPYTCLAALVLRETWFVGDPSPRIAALLESFPKSAPLPRNLLELRGSGAERRRVDTAALSEGAPTGPRTQRAALHVSSVRSGIPQLEIDGTSVSELVDADDQGLVARATGERPVFAFSGENALANALALIGSGNRIPIESWLRRGGRPPLRLVHREQAAFGRVVHPGASEATPLCALSVTLRLPRETGSIVFVDFSL